MKKDKETHKNTHLLKSQNQIIGPVITILTIISMCYIGFSVILAFLRIPYPYELSWFEADALNQVMRILAGKNIYVAPSTEYIPMIYAPFYYYVSALVAKILGPELYSLRIVSFLSTLGTMYIIFRFIHNETKNFRFSIIGVGLFTMTYVISGTLWDLARTDLLFIFLLFLSLYFTRFGTSKLTHMFAAFLFLMAYLTKQNALVMLPFITMYYLISTRRFAVYYLMTFLISSAIVFRLFDSANSGWYSYFVYVLIKKHVFDSKNLMIFFGYDVLQIFFALLVSLFYIKVLLVNRYKSGMFYLFMIGGIIVLSGLGRLNIGGSGNTQAPMYAAIAIVFGPGLFYIFQRNIKKNILECPYISFLFLLILLQYTLLLYNPFLYIPDKNTQESTSNLVSFLKSQPSTILAPSNIYLLKLSNKPVHADFHMLNELLGGFGDNRPTREGTLIITKFKQHIEMQSYDIIVLEKYDYFYYYFKFLDDVIKKKYKKIDIQYFIWRGTRAIPIDIYVRK